MRCWPQPPCCVQLINCVSVAVALALRRHGVSRVMVVDWDVHHGNGTEALFDDNPDVLYVSTHQQGIFPVTGAAVAPQPLEAPERS